MSVGIVLDGPYKRGNFRTQLFFPGDRVSGKVILNLQDDENIESVIIELKGKYRTMHRERDHEHEHVTTMFALQKILFKGPFKMRAAKHEYPFSFTFPEQFNYNFLNFRTSAAYNQVRMVGPGPLPPHLDHEDFSAGVSIYYHLTARVPRTFVDWEDKIALNFYPYRTELNPAPNPMTNSGGHPTYGGSDFAGGYGPPGNDHRYYRVTHEGIPRPLTKTEAFKEGIHHKAENLKVNFWLSAKAPTNIIIGKPYTLELTLECKDTGTGDSLPGFLLKDYQFFLKPKTDIRVPGIMYDHEHLIDGTYITLRTGSFNTTMTPNKTIQINGMFPTTETYACPSFISWAARRNYGLELKADVWCLEEKTHFKLHWYNVTLFSPRAEPGVEEGMRSIESGTASISLGEQARLGGDVDFSALSRNTNGVLPQYER